MLLAISAIVSEMMFMGVSDKAEQARCHIQYLCVVMFRNMNTSSGRTHPITGGWSQSTLVNERNKLKATESDWNLAGVSGSLTSTRTRNSGQ
jgi:hypothetical protein